MIGTETSIDALSGVVLELQRKSRQPLAEDFRVFALGVLQRSLPFDSGIWGDGYIENGAPQIRSVHLHNRPAEMLADYESIKHQDPLFAAAANNPGRAVAMERAKVDVPPVLREYLIKWRLAQFMSVVLADPLTALLTSVGIWRDADDRPFSESERQLFEHALPHLLETYSTNRILRLIHAARPGNSESFARGVVDANRHLVVAPHDFVSLLIDEWPRWRGPQLPQELGCLVENHAGARFVGERVFFKSASMDGVFLIQARPRRAADELTVRELEIAEGFARGLSAKQVAKELGISTETVRDHVARIFRKLDVKNQAQMIWKIRRAP